MHSARGKWRAIGTQLHLDPCTLDDIEAADMREPGEGLRKTLLEWLKRAHPLPTLRTLAETLRSSVVHEEALAQQLETFDTASQPQCS